MFLEFVLMFMAATLVWSALELYFANFEEAYDDKFFETIEGCGKLSRADEDFRAFLLDNFNKDLGAVLLVVMLLRLPHHVWQLLSGTNKPPKGNRVLGEAAFFWSMSHFSRSPFIAIIAGAVLSFYKLITVIKGRAPAEVLDKKGDSAELYETNIIVMERCHQKAA